MCDGETDILVSVIAVFGDFILQFEDIGKLVEVYFVLVLDAEVINHRCKGICF
jgi:hypothetical protein